MIQNKEILSAEQGKARLLEGINTLADAVTSTLGASGATVILEDMYGNAAVTKDGVSVSRNIKLKDHVANIGCTILKQSAEKTVDSCGDGTTSTILLAQYLINKGDELVKAGYKPFEIKRGVERATAEVIKLLDERSIDVTDNKLKDVATVSANNDVELGTIIADAFVNVGKDGAVTIEESVTGITHTTSVEGLEVLRGFDNPYYITDKKKEVAVLEKPFVLLVESKIQSTSEITPFLEFIAQNDRSLLIIGEIDEDVQAMLFLNKVKGGLKICSIQPPHFGNKRKALMEDLAVATGATLIDDKVGDNFENFTFDFLGELDKAIIDKSTTTLITDSNRKEAVSVQISKLKELREEQTEQLEKVFIDERIAKLAGRVAVIHVGGKTEVEMKERLDRVDDAVSATKAAISEGISPGGGIGLYDISFEELIATRGNKSINAGVLLLKQTLMQPLTKILTNAGLDVSEIKSTIVNDGDAGYGYNVKTDTYGNMINMGITDPTKVLKHSLMNAVSVAMTILTTNYTVTNLYE